MALELKYWGDDYGEVVEMVDGRPVRYSSLGGIPGPEAAVELAVRIRQLTGFAVRFGEWEEVAGDPRDGQSTVALFVVEPGEG
jgi:hypothetical protein